MTTPAEQARGADPVYEDLRRLLYDLIWSLYDGDVIGYKRSVRLQNDAERITKDLAALATREVPS